MTTRSTEEPARISYQLFYQLVTVGDTVIKDQGVLVVEAMKMENEIKAAGPGVVKELLVKPRQAVEAGEMLARLE